MTVRNSYQESNILKMHFASLRLCAKLGSQRRRDAKSIKDKGCEKYSTTNLFCQRVLVTDSHIKKVTLIFILITDISLSRSPFDSNHL